MKAIFTLIFIAIATLSFAQSQANDHQMISVTTETIKNYKELVRGDLSRIFVGGIMATLMPKELWEETGVTPLVGLLDRPGILDNNNNLVIDHMIPDYSLFDGTPYTGQGHKPEE